MTEIDFRDPPELNRTGGSQPNAGVWIQMLAPLKEHPGRWACVSTKHNRNSAVTTVSALRAGRLQRPTGRWEFVSRGKEVFARYLGEDESE